MDTKNAPQMPPTKVSWFELFYDLVIVAAIAHGGHLIVSDLLITNSLTFSLGLWLAATFIITFTLWFSTSMAINIAPGVIPLRKTMMFGQMLAVTVANLALSREDGLPDDWGFAALAISFATVSIIYAIIGHHRPELAGVTRPWRWCTAAAAILFALGVALPDPWITVQLVVLALGLLTAVIPILVVAIPRLCRSGHLEPEHFAERVGQLVIIVIGESFLGLVGTLGGLDSIPGPTFFVLTFLVAGSMWTIYFTSVFPLGVPLTSGRLELWLGGVMLFLVGSSYMAEILAAYAAVDWSSLSVSHTFIPLSALYALLGALLLGWLGGQKRDRAFARVHIIALAVLGVVWLALVLAGSLGNWLLLASSIIVIADGLACYASGRRSGEMASRVL